MYGTRRIALLSLLVLLTRCGQEVPELRDYESESSSSKSKTTQTSTSTKSTVSFKSAVKPILSAKCSSCHGSDVTTYADLMDMDVIVAGNPSASELYQQVASGKMPQTGAKLTSAQLKVLSTWIKEGAKNN